MHRHFGEVFNCLGAVSQAKRQVLIRHVTRFLCENKRERLKLVHRFDQPSLGRFRADRLVDEFALPVAHWLAKTGELLVERLQLDLRLLCLRHGIEGVRGGSLSVESYRVKVPSE